MSLSFSSSTSCEDLSDAEQCGGCGWKCDCISCTSNEFNNSIACHCSCRFWIVVCCIVAFGFVTVFFVSVLYKRLLLSFMSFLAVLMAVSFSSLSILTDGCVWPAFFAVTLVFAFPCFYSCCWNYHSRRAVPAIPNGLTMASIAEEDENYLERDKPAPAVVIQSPGGEFQIGMEIKMEKTNGENEGGITGELVAGSSSNSSIQLRYSVDSRHPLNSE